MAGLAQEGARGGAVALSAGGAVGLACHSRSPQENLADATMGSLREEVAFRLRSLSTLRPRSSER